MAGRALPSLALALLLSAGASSALADTETIAVGEPAAQDAPQTERPALPKLLGYGKGEDGTHVFLFGRRNAPPVVFIGQPGALEELEVLNMERVTDKFLVDTLEMGDIVFNTTEKSVIIPGDVGFIQKRPTRVMKGRPDKAVFVEAMQKMGFVRAPSPVQVPQASGARVIARPREMLTTGGPSRLGIFQQTAARSKVTARAKNTRRPTARVRSQARGRQAVRTTARATVH